MNYYLYQMNYLTTKETADIIGVGRQRVIQLIHERKLEAIVKDGRFFIHKETAESFKRTKPTGRPPRCSNPDDIN